jgi:hypothetical protein
MLEKPSAWYFEYSLNNSSVKELNCCPNEKAVKTRLSVTDFMKSIDLS